MPVTEAIGRDGGFLCIDSVMRKHWLIYANSVERVFSDSQQAWLSVFDYIVSPRRIPHNKMPTWYIGIYIYIYSV